MENFKIIIASRLKNNPVARFLSELGTTVKYVSLRRGEFVLSTDIGVKYMTGEQFIQAISNRSIYRDIIELKREFASPVVIVEGLDPLHDPRLDLTMAHAALLFMSVLNRVPVLFANNEVETAQMLFMLTGQVSSGLEMKMDGLGEKAIKPVEVSTADDPRRRIVESIPSVSPARAEALLQHFGSLARLFAAEVDDLRQVEGVGPKRAKEIFGFLSRDEKNQPA
ncbi:MAG: hypothetical protein GY841_15100 [FCB group bacterium]|nr:hypothetical protein [FCB group bacterium]